MNILITILLKVAGIIALFLIITPFLKKRNNMSNVKLSSMHSDKKYLTFKDIKTSLSTLKEIFEKYLN